jgi:hypothetical protein
MNDCQSIQHETSEFLHLQICGKCSVHCQCRLTKVDLTDKAKSLLKPIWDFIYFRDSKLCFSSEEIKEVHQILIDLQNQVSVKEINLVKYIALIVDGCTNKAQFEILKDAYSLTKSFRYK